VSAMVTVPGDHQGGRVGPPRAYLGQQRETVRPGILMSVTMRRSPAND